MEGESHAHDHLHLGTFDNLPDDIVLIILSNLDLVTLCRFSATCRRILHLLSELRLLSTSMPLSPLASRVIEGISRPLAGHLLLYTKSLLNGPTLHHTDFVLQFFTAMSTRVRDPVTISWVCQRLDNLDSLEFTLENSLSSPRCSHWFWWDGELHGMIRPNGHIAMVIGDNDVLVQDDKMINQLIQITQCFLHIFLHWLSAKVILYNMPNLRSIVTKYSTNDKGCLRLYRDFEEPVNNTDPGILTESLKDWLLSDRRLRFQLSYLPASIKLNNNSVQAKNTWFFFVSWVKEDDTTEIDDLIRSCLRLDQLGPNDDRKELKETVNRVLAHQETQTFVGLRS